MAKGFIFFLMEEAFCSSSINVADFVDKLLLDCDELLWDAFPASFLVASLIYINMLPFSHPKEIARSLCTKDFLPKCCFRGQHLTDLTRGMIIPDNAS